VPLRKAAARRRAGVPCAGALVAACACACLGASAAGAAGLGIPDLGGDALGQAGAQIASPGNLTALWYNPAGLASIDGILVLQLDPRATWHRVGFQRLTSAGTNPQGFAPVENGGGISLTSLAPIGGAAWRIPDAPVPMVVALGGFPYNGATGYNYIDPDALRAGGATGRVVQQLAPQRYANIFSGNKVYIAALGFAARPWDWLDLGATFQLVNASFASKQSVSSGLAQGEDPNLDAQLKLSGADYLRPSGSFGLSVHLPHGFDVGLVYQLPYRIHANGTITADLSPALVAAGAAIQGQDARFHLTLPWFWRAGVRFKRPLFEVELAATFEGWSTYSQVRIVPADIRFTLGGSTTQLPEIILQKGLTDTGSVRLGGKLHLGKLAHALEGLTVNAGALYEGSAVPSERQSLDLAHWARGAGTLGVTYDTGRWAFSVAYAHFVQPDLAVRDSTVQQVVALPGTVPTVVGNGDYTSQIDLLSASVLVRLSP
jgi:hypothetical protein